MLSTRPYLCLTLATILGISFGCQKKSGSKTLDDSVAKPAVGLDVNDVSILFPLPHSVEAIQKMLPVNFVNADGQTSLTPTIFETMLKSHDKEIEVEGKKVNLKSSSKFDGVDRQITPGQFGPYNQIADWKIVAMRFDPCAPTPVHNLRGKGLATPRDRFDPEACLIQLRLTAQPVIDAKREKVGGIVAVGDYAIHMLFALNEDAARTIYRELVAFKQDCGDLTSSTPLMQHPCLVKENNKTGVEGPFHQQIQGLIKRNAKNLIGTAMMATHNGDDPWSFMNGTIEKGEFKHQKIDAVTKDDPATFKRNKDGVLLEPFSNGWFQQIAFFNVSGGQGLNIRVSPAPLPEKANTFLLNEYNIRQQQSAEVFAKTAALENPLMNDFFSTDCGSCHAAQHIFSQLAGLNTSSLAVDIWLADQTISRDVLAGGTSTIAQYHKIWTQAEIPNAYLHDGPYSQASDNVTRKAVQKRGAGFPNSLVHFGYIQDTTRVSQRVINESILTAKMANAFYGEGREPPVRCSQKELKLCMAEGAVTSYNSTDLASCLAMVCVERGRELRDSIKQSNVKHYRVKKQIESDGWRFKVGTIFIGTFHIVGWDKENWRFRSVNYIGAESLSGEKVIMDKEDLPPLAPINKLGEYFEEVNAEPGSKLPSPPEPEVPECRDASSDRDAHGVEDGWGWEDGRSCRVNK